MGGGPGRIGRNQRTQFTADAQSIGWYQGHSPGDGVMSQNLGTMLHQTAEGILNVRLILYPGKSPALAG